MKIGFLTTCLPECSFNDVIDVAKLDKKDADNKWRIKC